MVSKRNHHSIVPFSITIPFHLASFYATKQFWKKKLGEMLIEQIIKFELKGPGFPGHRRS